VTIIISLTNAGRIVGDTWEWTLGMGKTYDALEMAPSSIVRLIWCGSLPLRMVEPV
jgi:hypothetical protein